MDDTGAKLLHKTDNWRLYIIDVHNFFSFFIDWKKHFIWSKQRPINDTTVDRIMNHITLKPDALKSINMNITFATICGDDPKIIDGQDRLAALEHLESDTKFLVSIIDFRNEEQRFLEFISINNNTPLPEFYRDISDYDSYCKTIAKEIVNKLLVQYPAIVSEYPLPYYLHKTHVESIYDALKKYLVPIENNIEYMIDGIICHCSQFQRVISDFPVMSPNSKCCLSQKNANDMYNQCPNAPKPIHGGFCGTHKNQKFPYNPIFKRKFRAEQLKDDELFILHPEWASIIVSKYMYL